MKKINIDNKAKMFVLISFIFVFFCISIVIPTFFINYLSHSGIGHFFSRNIAYGIISIVVLFYFILIGKYYYKIEIDSYVIKIKSERAFVSFFSKNKYIDIPHYMLRSYSFNNIPFTFNTKLKLNLETKHGKKLIKKFKFSLLSLIEEKDIKKKLDKIITKNI